MEAAQWAHSLPGLSVLFPCLSHSISLPFSLSPSLSSSLFPPSLSLSLFCSPHPLSVPLNSPFLLSPSNSPHLSAPCPGFSIHFSLSLSRPAFKTPAGSLLFPRDPNSVSLAVTPENQALVFSPPLCPLPPFFFSKRHDCIFNLGRLSFPPP